MLRKILFFGLILCGMIACQKQKLETIELSPTVVPVEPMDYRDSFVVGTYIGYVTKYEGSRYGNPQLPPITHEETVYLAGLIVTKDIVANSLRVECVGVPRIRLRLNDGPSYLSGGADFFFYSAYESINGDYGNSFNLQCFTSNDSIYYQYGNYNGTSIKYYDGIYFSGHKQ